MIGGPSVVAAAASRSGTPLQPGDTLAFTADDLIDRTRSPATLDLAMIYVDATVDGDGLSFSYLER